MKMLSNILFLMAVGLFISCQKDFNEPESFESIIKTISVDEIQSTNKIAVKPEIITNSLTEAPRDAYYWGWTDDLYNRGIYRGIATYAVGYDLYDNEIARTRISILCSPHYMQDAWPSAYKFAELSGFNKHFNLQKNDYGDIIEGEFVYGEEGRLEWSSGPTVLSFPTLENIETIRLFVYKIAVRNKISNTGLGTWDYVQKYSHGPLGSLTHIVHVDNIDIQINY